jgi:hypothetical protein
MLLVACADLRLLGSQGWIEVFTETPALESGPLSCASAYAFTNTTGDWQVPYPEYGTAPTTSVLGNPHA